MMLNSLGLVANPLRVLHVDDHPLHRRMVAEILAAAGHDAVEARSGLEALAWLDRQPCDLVLMDINMPGMGGLEALRRLRGSSGPARGTPVIAVTSEVSRTTAAYLALGFAGFVGKPFGVAQLLAAVTACARRPREAMPADPLAIV